MYCSNCGKNLRTEARFCPNCGASVNHATETHSASADVDKINNNQFDVSWLGENEELGRFWPRFGAYVFDYALAGVGGWIIVGFIVGIFSPDSGFFENISFTADRIFTFSMVIMYHMICLANFSTTLGKKIFGLRVVDETTKKAISTNQAIKRSLSYFLSSLLFGIGFLRIINNPKKQGWHEEIAKTYVVRDTNQTMIPGAILAILTLLLLIYSNAQYFQ